MTLTPVTVSLVAADGTTVTASGSLQEYSSVDRIRRAATVVGIFILLAASLIPIPIVHLLGIPLMLIIGLVLGGRQLTISCRIKPMRVACPRCGGPNRVGGGLGLRSSTDPVERMCEECRRPLTVTLAPR